MERIEPHELLSAYLDAEVTPTERAEAERLLESSPELRADLDDFARLSDLIRGLPREAAPSELAVAIRQQAERQALLGPEPAMPKRSLRREIVSALIGMAATAAGMLLMLRTADRAEDPFAAAGKPVAALSADRTDLPMAEFRGSPSSAAMEAEASAPAEVALIDQPDAKRIGLPSAAAPPSPSMALKQGRMSVPPETIPRMANSKVVARDGSPAAASDELMNTDNLNWRSLHIGDVVPYFERSGNGVAVVELSVVDIRQTADQMEILLRRYDVPVIQESVAPPEENPSTESKSTASLKSEFNADAGDLVTFYVDLPSSDLANFLNDLGDQNLFLTAHLQPPVDLPPLIDAEKLAEPADPSREEQLDSTKETEQLVKQEAAEATNLYVNRRSISQVPTVDEANPRNLAQKPGSGSSLRGASADAHGARGATNVDRKPAAPLAKKDSQGKGLTETSNDVQLVPQQSNLLRQRRNAIAVQNTFNTAQALSGNSANFTGKQANSAIEKSAVTTPVEADHQPENKDRAAGESPMNESLPTPTVRLLLVLQQAAPAGAPPE